jgi:hypothetical protein
MVDAAEAVLCRARDLAGTPLEGIEGAAVELVTLAGDRATITRAYRMAGAAARMLPTRDNKQVAAILRRAIEVGRDSWGFDETGSPP